MPEAVAVPISSGVRVDVSPFSPEPGTGRPEYPDGPDGLDTDVRVVASPIDAIQQGDVSLVVVATPNGTHAPLAEAALRAGKHVVVDKPFTFTLDEARTLAATAEETGRLLSVHHNRRWDSDYLGVEQAVQARTIGDVVEFRSEIGRWRPQVRDR